MIPAVLPPDPSPLWTATAHHLAADLPQHRYSPIVMTKSMVEAYFRILESA